MTQLKRPRSPHVHVSVTREIMERSVRANSKVCMIAEAMKAAVPNATGISVDIQTCRMTDPRKGLRYIYLTPRIGQKALLDFDAGSYPEPFEITLKDAHVVKANIRKGSKAESLLKTPAYRNRVPSTPTIRDASSSRPTPVGGKPPPQMRTRRRFGLKAFIEAVPPGANVVAGADANLPSP
jgi:hypothetical protein